MCLTFQLLAQKLENQGEFIEGKNDFIDIVSQSNKSIYSFRSIADGQSHHSFSNQSHRGYLGSSFPQNIVNSRPGNLDHHLSNRIIAYDPNFLPSELRQSRTSLAAASERMSRASYAGSIHGAAQSIASSTRRTRPRSRSRDQLNTAHLHSNRPGSR